MIIWELSHNICDALTQFIDVTFFIITRRHDTN